MLTKKCPFCHVKSYSASSHQWICPHCGRDLSGIIPNEEAGSGTLGGAESEEKIKFYNEKGKDGGG